MTASHRFPRTARVRARSDFDRIFKHGRRVALPVLALHWLSADAAGAAEPGSMAKPVRRRQPASTPIASAADTLLPAHAGVPNGAEISSAPAIAPAAASDGAVSASGIAAAIVNDDQAFLHVRGLPLVTEPRASVSIGCSNAVAEASSSNSLTSVPPLIAASDVRPDGLDARVPLQRVADGRRLGLAVSRKVDPRAVGRNRIKRILREYFRHHRHALAAADYVVVARPGAAALDAERLTRALTSLLRRAGALPATDAPGTMPRAACEPASAPPLH